MLKNILLCLLFLFITSEIKPQNQQHNISGFVKEKLTSEPLIGSNILVYKDTMDFNKSSFSGAAANNYGYYVVPKIPAGTYYVIVRHIGFKPVIRQVEIAPDQLNVTLNIDMLPEDIELEEVVVTGKKDDIANVSRIDISPELLARLPSLTGEIDLFRMLQTLPGVKSSTEVSNGLYVRGGSPDQNLTLVDGVILYNPSHLGNIASTFNSNAIRDIKLIKGGFPAQYGGRLSSVLDVKLRTGSKEEEEGIVGIGLINSFVTLEGPISDMSTYMVSARTMYYDLVQEKIDKNGATPRYNFYDVNAKLTFEYSERNIVSLSALFNSDKLYSPHSSRDIDYEMGWRNSIVSLNWLHINSKNLFLNTTISFIDYTSESFINRNPDSASTIRYNASSNLVDFNIKQDVELFWHQDHILKTGLELYTHNYDILYSDQYDSLLFEDPYIGSKLKSFESAIYFQNESQFSSAFKTNLGIRLYYLGNSNYFEIEPRMSATYSLTGDIILKAGFGVANQYLHLISRNDITLPADVWFPSTPRIKPGKSYQFILGVDSYLDDLTYLVSLEGYYKRMKNLYEFNNILNYNLLENNIEEQFTGGEGESYGIEFFLNKRTGNLNGWIGYTLSWTRRRFENLNGGKVFYPRYDRKHDISLVLAYDFTETFSTGLTWVYATGSRYTVPPGKFLFTNFGSDIQQINYNYGAINNLFLPDYHKLDISFTYKVKWSNKQAEVYLNLYNVYNRNNPFAQFVVNQKDPQSGQIEPKVKRISYFPFIPTIGFNYKF